MNDTELARGFRLMVADLETWNDESLREWAAYWCKAEREGCPVNLLAAARAALHWERARRQATACHNQPEFAL